MKQFKVESEKKNYENKTIIYCNEFLSTKCCYPLVSPQFQCTVFEHLPKESIG